MDYRGYLAFVVTLILGFYQIVMWDTHAIEVIPLQIKHILGKSTQGDLERLTAICLERRHTQCVERSMRLIGQKDMTQIPRLAEYQLKVGQVEAALQSYRDYFQLGGADLKARYLFGVTLEHAGYKDEAARAYYAVVLDRANTDKTLRYAAEHRYTRLMRNRGVASSSTN